MREIIEIVKKYCALDEEVTLSSELKNLSLDSITFVEIIVDIEDLFGIEFDVDELSMANWQTVKDIVNSVEEKING